jgi:hypothetical protein
LGAYKYLLKRDLNTGSPVKNAAAMPSSSSPISRNSTHISPDGNRPRLRYNHR